MGAIPWDHADPKEAAARDRRLTAIWNIQAHSAQLWFKTSAS